MSDRAHGDPGRDDGEQCPRVLLVDDHAIVRSGFRRLLEAAGIACAEASNATEALHVHASYAPDVVVLDLALPGVGGIEVLRRLQARDPTVRVLVFSMHEGAPFVRQALQAGARGYLGKSSAPEVLIEAVEALLAGDRFVDRGLAARAAGTEDDDPFRVLTPREFETFRMLAEGRGTDEIARRLHLSAKTIANYQTQIRQKLGIEAPVDVLRLALRHGIVAGDAPPG